MSTDNEFSYPASTDFVTVNEWVHDTDRMFEELVCACLGLATELERMRYDRAELAAQPPAGYFIDVKTDGVSTGRMEQAADCYANDPDVFPLYRRAVPASNSMIEPGSGKALSDRAKHLVRLITGTHRGDIDTHRELSELIDSMAVAIDSPPAQPAQVAVAYLDLGAAGYMDIGTDLTDEALAALPKGRHMLGIVGTYGLDGYIPAQPAPSVPEPLTVSQAPHSQYAKGWNDCIRSSLASPPKPTPWNPSPEDLAAIRAAQELRAVVAEMPGGGIAFLNYGEADADYAHLDCPACGGSGHVGDTRAGAFRDVLAERRRQIEAEGWTPEHDGLHSTQELAFAAACYATADAGDPPPAVWPWHLSWWKPADRRRNLEKAGALILAEIERLDRAAAQKPEGE